MSIDSLPPALQSLVQGPYLDHTFRMIADRETVAISTGTTITKTCAGMLVPTTRPLDPTSNLALTG
jgi:hypothetical protein